MTEELEARQEKLANLRRKREEEKLKRQQQDSNSSEGESDCEEQVLCQTDASAEQTKAASSSADERPAGADQSDLLIEKTVSLTVIDVVTNEDKN